MSEKRNLTFYKYRHLIISIIIIIIVIILDIIFENYSEKVIQKINGNIEDIYEIFENETEDDDIKKLEKLSDKAIMEWKKREISLACFIEHEDVEKISVKLTLLNEEIKTKNWTDAKDTMVETNQLVKYLNDKYKLSLHNIF